MRKQTLLASTIALMALLPLTGCATGDVYSDLSREVTDDDAWPSDLPDYAARDLDVDSNRLVGHDGETYIYLVKSTEPIGGPCLLIYPDSKSWAVSCGGSGLRAGSGTATYILHPDGSPAEGTAISENVSVLR
jgi:hypothetical protein